MKTKLDIRKLTSVQTHIFALVLFAFIATILILSWFHSGKLYGGGDVGIPSYDPQRILDIARFVWWEASAPGITVSQGVTSVPLQFFQSLLQKIGLPYIAIQAILFWVILWASGYGMFLVARTIFDKNKFLLQILTGIFYILNPYMMIQVWHRFIHNTFVLMVALPFFYIFWRKWIREGKPSSLFIFLLINFLTVSLFGALAFFVTIILLIFLIAAAEIFIPWKGFNNFKIAFLRFLIGVIAMLCSHLWWLLPVINVVPPLVSAQHSTGSNLSTLISISNQSGTPFSLSGINPFYLYTNADFGEIFLTPFFLLLPWLFLLFFLPGFFISLTTRKLAFWACFYVLALFFAKGTASPFGHIYEFIFAKFFILGVLRNPYEKLGIFLPFSQSVLMVIGISWLVQFTKNNLIFRGLIIAVIVLSIGIFLWPMWLGKIFGTLEKPAFVEVPESYKMADQYISSSKIDGRILHLPLVAGEANSYKWKYGYSGVESSQLYFKSLSSVSRGSNVDFIDNSLTALAMIFKDDSTNKSRILKILQDFNVSFIVLHKDTIWKGGNLQDPYEIAQVLDGLSFLNKEKSFGDLEIYKLKDEFFKPRLVLSSNPDLLAGSYTGSFYPQVIKEKDSSDFISEVGTNSDQRLLNLSSEIVITPKSSWVYNSIELPTEQIIAELPSARILPDSFLYPLITLKENVQILSNPGQKQLVFKVTFAGKRLVEAYTMQKKGDTKHIMETIKSYERLIKDIFEENQLDLKEVISIGPYPLTDIFSRQRLVLKRLITQSSGEDRDKLMQTYELLSTYLRKAKFLPLYDTNIYNEENMLFRVVEFNVPNDGQFEIVLLIQNSENIYPDNLLSLKMEIDGKLNNLEGEKKGQFFHYPVKLTSGSHEFVIPLEYSIDLIKSSKDIVKEGNVSELNNEFEVNSTQHGESFLEAQIIPVAPLVWYKVSFEAWIKKGDKFRVQLIQDIDPPNPKDSQETVKEYDKYFSKDLYNNFWLEHKIGILLKPFTKKANIKFTVEPWDDCEIIVVKKKLCKDKKFKFYFEHEAVIAFRNIQIKRRFDNPIFLYSKKSELINMDSPGEVTKFERSSPVSFKGKVNVVKPGFLIFKDSYHPGWELKLNNAQGIYKPLKRYIANGFANAWFIDKPGIYSFELEFTPQKYIYLGIVISVATVSVVLGFVVTKKLKR